MTSSPASRVDQASADSAVSPVVSEETSAAVTLRDLIADAGPLPADAALECLQRVAERLRDNPGQAAWPLGPSRILIDDDGDVWLGAPSRNGRTAPGAEQPSRRVLDELAQLLTYLTTANADNLQSSPQAVPSEWPRSVSILANRLSSREEEFYASFAAIAADVAQLRNGMDIERAPLIEPEPVEEAKTPSEAASGHDPALDDIDDSERPVDSRVETIAPADDEHTEAPHLEMAAANTGVTRWLVAGGLALAALVVLVWLMNL